MPFWDIPDVDVAPIRQVAGAEFDTRAASLVDGACAGAVSAREIQAALDDLVRAASRVLYDRVPPLLSEQLELGVEQ